ncbi:uncharacterized protein LOC122562284 isoform X2 [Chiloscyllium plagiosum]|uniref:uncharacterized protein LOC122562284 isoform X2 n=1 Tax=Chiloscyllium plagiosum TaxID=36176 RepID=UPI001CB7C16A|nr:uncharacterized protein LOC122562284 isoform X2 [Chiloscyllium plagiosum]
MVVILSLSQENRIQLHVCKKNYLNRLISTAVAIILLSWLLLLEIWVLVLGSQAPVARHFWKKQRRCTLPISTVSSFPPCRGGLGERDPGWETLETRRDKVG